MFSTIFLHLRKLTGLCIDKKLKKGMCPYNYDNLYLQSFSHFVIDTINW